MESIVESSFVLTHYDSLRNRLATMATRQQKRSAMPEEPAFMVRARQRLGGPLPVGISSENNILTGLDCESESSMTVTVLPTSPFSVRKGGTGAISYCRQSARRSVDLHSGNNNDDLVFNACAIVNAIEVVLNR